MLNILKYLYQYPVSKQYIPYINSEIFDRPDYEIFYDAFKTYVLKYKNTPDLDNLMDFCKREGMKPTEIKILRKVGESAKEPLNDTEYVKEEILRQVKRQMLKSILAEHTELLESYDDKELEKFYTKIGSIRNFDIENNGAATSFLDDFNKASTRHVGIPTKFKMLNAFTGSGGFYTPQSIIFAKGPKRFGTGLMINIALGYMQDGYDIAYFDYENGEKAIQNRFKQALINVELKELYSNESKISLEKMLVKLRRIGSGNAMLRGMEKRDDIMKCDNELEKFNNLHPNFKPTAIFYDYLDIIATNKKGMDRRASIQQNYYDVVDVNKKHETFSFSVSKIKQSAVNNDYVHETDLAEDWEKIYNAHAVFGWVSSEEQMLEGYYRMHPIVQRDGVSYTKMAAEFAVDEKIMKCNEVLDEE